MPKFDPRIHHRRSIRLKGYDYTQAGAYFVTIVAYQRECLFGEIVDGEMRLNEYGRIVQKWWNEIPIHFPNVELGAFVIMPNHVHGIIFITAACGGEVLSPRDSPKYNNQDVNDIGIRNQGGETPPRLDISINSSTNTGEETPPPRKPTLGQIVAYFKYQSTKEMNRIETNDAISKFWQRNYYERIIRSDHAMDNIWRYIESNPGAWEGDDENPRRKGK